MILDSIQVLAHQPALESAEDLAGEEVLGEVVDEHLVAGAGVLEQPVVGRQADLEGVLVLVLLPRTQAGGPGASGKTRNIC